MVKFYVVFYYLKPRSGIAIIFVSKTSSLRFWRFDLWDNYDLLSCLLWELFFLANKLTELAFLRFGYILIERPKFGLAFIVLLNSIGLSEFAFSTNSALALIERDPLGVWILLGSSILSWGCSSKFFTALEPVPILLFRRPLMLDRPLLVRCFCRSMGGDTIGLFESFMTRCLAPPSGKIFAFSDYLMSALLESRTLTCLFRPVRSPPDV